ncbi:hypothetical protein [Streptomyces sp. FIT100]|uniref:hypothetical protein n=1 Tax=Streptomyces sp. FIT100 TaxID=2837956 RepID=UPI0021C9C205|nr:hypothetical protein [Streptomyces sp. FIT100]UUN27463.1 hypothetical protein KK483_14435 [Streptomyces sp. FIT100]
MHTIEKNSWTSVTTSLAVTREKVDAAFVSQTLGLADSPADSTGAFIAFGSEWWAYTFDERFPGGLEGQAVALVQQISPRMDGLRKLHDAGYAVQVAVSGTVETGNELNVSPNAVGQLARLGLPVSFTTLTASGTHDEDPLSWLD